MELTDGSGEGWVSVAHADAEPVPVASQQDVDVRSVWISALVSSSLMTSAQSRWWFMPQSRQTLVGSGVPRGRQGGGLNRRWAVREGGVHDVGPHPSAARTHAKPPSVHAAVQQGRRTGI